MSKSPVRVNQSLSEMAEARRSVIASTAIFNAKPAQVAKALEAYGIVNPTTGKPFSRQTIRADMRAAKKQLKTAETTQKTEVLNNGIKVFSRPMSETIGQWTYVKPQWNARILLNVDTTWRDYVFWDALRRGTAPGYEISGPAFCLPAAQTIASYAFGKGIGVSLIESAVPDKEKSSGKINEAATLSFADYMSEANGKPTQNKLNAINTGGQSGGKPSQLSVMPKPKPAAPVNVSDPVAWTNLQLAHMVESNQGFFLSNIVDNYCLGNTYIIINPDCTFSVASPETVEVEYSAADYRKVQKVIITTKMQGARVQDTYTDDKRTIFVHYYDEREDRYEEYENLIGRIPIVHFANDRSANEIYGRPIYEAGLPIMWRYDALINNILEGVTLLGTPIPTFTGLEDPEGTKRTNSTAVTYTDELGNEQTEYVTRLDRQTGLYIGKGGDAKMLATNVGFTKDSIDSLHQLKLLWLHQTHIPEFILGGAIASSKASTESQMPPFITYVNFRRLMLEGQGANPTLGIEAHGGLLELFDIWLRMYKLLNPNIVVAPIKISWPDIDLMADQMRYLWGSYLSGAGYITPEAAVKMSGYIEDPESEVMKAAGKKPRVPKYDDYEKAMRLARLQAMQASMDTPGEDDGPGWMSDYTPVLNDIGAGQSGDVATHQHASGPAMGDPWSINGPLYWINMLTGGGG